MTPGAIRGGQTRQAALTEGLDAAVTLGGPGARLLAGPAARSGWEHYDEHVSRLGLLDLTDMGPADVRSIVAESGLVGRGGGEFPLATKLGTVAARIAEAAPIVVVNASEGEPASRKDSLLMGHRPHLVLDGAEVAARAVGARDVVVYAHRSRRRSYDAMSSALTERPRGALRFRLVDAPPRYVAGESSAVASFLSGSGALPKVGPPVALFGVNRRPTLVSNAETIAHLALVARFGPRWWAGAGDALVPGSTLLTLAGEVAEPGTVIEMLRPVPLGRLLAVYGESEARMPRAVLVGGYEGIWVDGAAADALPLSRGLSRSCGVPLGCGSVAVLQEGACGIATTARLAGWLAGQSAGQCGPCHTGLPAIADRLEDLAAGRATRSDLRDLYRLTAGVRGRGACGHPTGFAGLVESALSTFSTEVRQHVRGASCPPATRGFPLPVVRTLP